jgi:hypothetical protein
MRRDHPWSVPYQSNWGQIVGDVSYFAAGEPPMLRPLWSLSYRWDGVHEYTPGANLIYETIARDLLSIPVVQG